MIFTLFFPNATADVGQKRKYSQVLTPTKSKSNDLLTEEPGKARNEEGKLAERLTELVNKHEFSISINNSTLVFPADLRHRVNLNPLAKAKILSYDITKQISLGIPALFNDPNDNEVPITDYSLLQTMSESKFQVSDEYQTSFVASPHTHCMDLSASGKKIFHIASAVNRSGTSASNDNTAKPDVVGLILPKMKEIKTDKSAQKGPASKYKPTSCCFEVVLQAVDRVVVESDMKAYYTRFTCDAITSRNAYIISLTVGTEGERHIDITRISHSDINKLWIVQTRYAIACPDYYVSEDATVIVDALLAFKIQWNVCRVSRVAQSSSRVYFVTLPDKDGHLPLHHPAFAIKINFSMPRFNNELRALQDIAQQHKNAGCEHYALAYYRRVNNRTSTSGNLVSHLPVHYLTELIQKQTSISLPGRRGIVRAAATSLPDVTQTTWYLHCMGDRHRPAGVLFLHVGTQNTHKPKHSSAARIQSGLIFSFEQALLAGWLQTDMRTDNILYFRRLKRWCIIDYDLAVRINDSKVTLTPGSARASACGGSVEKLLLSKRDGGDVTVDWTPTTEMTMLIKLCVKYEVRETVRTAV